MAGLLRTLQHAVPFMGTACYTQCLRVIAIKPLRDFWVSGYADSEQPLRAWLSEAESARWTSPNDIKNHYAHASILNGCRVVFNIGGNKFRLVTEIHFNTGFVYVRFIGTHAQYDKIEAETIL